MAQEQVIIEFIGDTEKLKASFNELIQLQLKSAALNDEQASTFTQMNQDAVKAAGQTSAALQTGNAQIKQFTDGFKQLRTTIVNANLASTAQTLSQLGDNAADAADRQKLLTNAIDSSRKVAAAFTNTLSQTDQKLLQIAQTRKQLQGIGDALNNVQSPTNGSTSANLAKQEASEKQMMQVSVDFAKQTGDAIFAIEDEARNAKYNAEISNLQKQSEFQLQNKNLTDAQRAAIEKKYASEQAAIKLQQWKADQKAKEEQAVINGALAVTSVLASAWDDPTGIMTAIKIAAAVATTATQVAVISAQKPPQFAKGTPAGGPSLPKGMKLVGEQGPELIYTPGGERIIAAPETAMLLEKYGVPQLPQAAAMKGAFAIGPSMPALDYNKLAKSVAEAIRANPSAHLHLDKSGFSTYMAQKGSKHGQLNNKFQA